MNPVENFKWTLGAGVFITSVHQMKISLFPSSLYGNVQEVLKLSSFHRSARYDAFDASGIWRALQVKSKCRVQSTYVYPISITPSVKFIVYGLSIVWKMAESDCSKDTPRQTALGWMVKPAPAKIVAVNKYLLTFYYLHVGGICM